MASELWRDCAAWLTRWKVLPPDHKANWPEASVIDLAYILRDGVLLCNLLNALDPGCMDMKIVNKKPQMAQFLCLRNIKAFLHVCQTAFGLKESDLFEPSMLFDLSDFFRVLNTLSKLSNCPKVLRKNLPGFDAVTRRSQSDDDIYRNLYSSDEEPNYPDQKDVEYGGYSGIQDEDIYHDLCSIEGVGVGAAGRDSQASRRLVTCSLGDHGAASIGHEKRDFVINELVETEGNYIQVLVTVIQHFMRPLFSVLPEEDYGIIFADFKELHEIHSGFHHQLRLTCGFAAPDLSTQHKKMKIGDVFLAWRERFLIYGNYCSNLPKVQALLQNLCSRSEIINQEIIKCQQEANKGKFSLKDIISVPMQRILKYHLLLDKLVSETSPNHEDYRSIERAKEAMVDVAQFINEVKKDSDTLDIMHNLQRSISDWNMPENTELKDYGRLIIDGELKVKDHDDQKSKVRYVFVFDQMLLMCKITKQGEQFKFRDCLRLWEYKVADEVSRRTVHSDARWSYQWYLYHKTKKTAFTLYALTKESKRKWIKAINDALDNVNPSGCKDTDHKFQMHSFVKPTTCSHCSKFLKGKIFQGYKCERCSVSVHKWCIPNSGHCGQVPPELPPRPPLSSAFSPSRQELPAIDDRIPLPTQNHLWFVGEMDRERASELLEREREGTFLVRIRPRGPTNPSESAFALSLKTDSKVEHMKVYEKHMNGVPNFSLSESRFFSSIVELVDFYQQTSLDENFVGLHDTLQWPYGRTEAIVQFDFEPTDTNQLRLQRGRRLVVLGKEGDHKGWWKGRIEDQIGFFPKEYVREIMDSSRSPVPYGFHDDIP